MIWLILASVLTTPDYAQREVVYRTIQESLRDPQSANFRNMVVNDKGHFCVEVNAKNGFGGYTGYQVWSGRVRMVEPNTWKIKAWPVSSVLGFRATLGSCEIAISRGHTIR